MAVDALPTPHRGPRSRGAGAAIASLLTVRSRGTVALPADLRRRLHLDRPDAQIKLIEREDGRIELVPVVAVPADQAWFWTDRWQAMERDADADIAAGRVAVVDGADELVAHLDT